jgi:hypothetical protein
MRQSVPHEVNPAALPGGAEHLGDSGLDALMGIGDDELHAAQASAASLRRNSVQIGSASDVPTSIPRTSRRPSLLTPTAMMTATETMRPPRLTFRYVG